MYFRFVQLEFPWALGPADGRYVARAPGAEDAEHVLVLRTLGAPQRRLLRRRRPREAAPGADPAPVATARATVIDAAPVASADAARDWLVGARGGEEAEARVAEAVVVLNRALAAHRVAAADPNLREVSREQALVARLGYGRGEEVADGHWTEALELAPAGGRRGRRAAVLRPQERLASLLGGRDEPLVCEDLVLRARVDLDRGATRAAALQLRVALEAALAELEAHRDVADLTARIDELRTARTEVGDAANAALVGPLDADRAAAVERVTGRLEAALRAKAAAGR
jgi:hypothetical protein